MKKLILISLSLILLVFISGCTQQPTGQVIINNANQEHSINDSQNQTSNITENKSLETQNNSSQNSTKSLCADGTLYDSCSSDKPKYCINGTLIDKCSKCGCPTGKFCSSSGNCYISTGGGGGGGSNSFPTNNPPVCTESWSCSDWSNCTNNQQTRTCTDANNCGTTNNKPTTSQSCLSCPSSCDDGNPYTYDYCNETTSFQCAHVLVGCVNNDGICPLGCTNQNDSDCYILKILETNFEIQSSRKMYVDNNYIYLATDFSGTNVKNYVKIYDKNSLNLSGEIEIITNNPYMAGATSIYVDNDNIFVGTADNEIRIYNKLDFSLKNNISNISENVCGGPSAIVSDDNNVYVGFRNTCPISNNYSIAIYSKSNYSLINKFVAHSEGWSGINALKVDNNYLYSASNDKSIKVWDKTGNLVKTLNQNYYAENLQLDDNYIYSLDAKGQDNTDKINIWRKSDFGLDKIIPLDWFRPIGLLIDNNYIYVGWGGSDGNTIKAWRKDDGSFVKIMFGNEKSGPAWPLAIDENYIYVYGYNNNIQIWKK